MTQHVMYTRADFTDEELENNNLARMVVEGGLDICKLCGGGESDLLNNSTCEDVRTARKQENR